MTRIAFLSRDDIEAVHAASLEVLEKTGVLVKNQDAIDILEKGGCPVTLNTVKIPNDLVEECLRKAPKSFELYARDGRQSLHI
ncbi:MAG: trimethylamine methyltransferase family protein, partial [Candidatus Thorarchaeota archaeon]